jgi:UPF0716 protein FxsA
MVILLLATLIIWPVAEIVLMVLVAQAIGFFWMLLLLFLSAVAGLVILQQRGRVHWMRFREAVGRRQPPAREAFDGVMITAGASLLIIPGFISSGLGLVLLFPPTRAVVRALLVLLFARRFKVAATAASWGASRFGYRSGSPYDFEGEAVDVTWEEESGEPVPRALPSPPANRPESRNGHDPEGSGS